MRAFTWGGKCHSTVLIEVCRGHQCLVMEPDRIVGVTFIWKSTPEIIFKKRKKRLEKMLRKIANYYSTNKWALCPT